MGSDKEIALQQTWVRETSSFFLLNGKTSQPHPHHLPGAQPGASSPTKSGHHNQRGPSARDDILQHNRETE